MDAYPDMMILIYTDQDNPTYFARAASRGLFDFVLKSTEPKRLLRSVLASPSRIPPTESLLAKTKRFLTQPNAFKLAKIDNLTKRENQILIHLAFGLSNREICNVLDISLETVKEHVQNVLRKLKMNDRTEAAVWAVRNGIPMSELN